jgi:hypothetical protein
MCSGRVPWVSPVLRRDFPVDFRPANVAGNFGAVYRMMGGIESRILAPEGVNRVLQGDGMGPGGRRTAVFTRCRQTHRAFAGLHLDVGERGGHVGAGARRRSRSIRRRIAANNGRGMATSANWNTTRRAWCTTLAPVLMSLSRSVVRVQHAAGFRRVGNGLRRRRR